MSEARSFEPRAAFLHGRHNQRADWPSASRSCHSMNAHSSEPGTEHKPWHDAAGIHIDVRGLAPPGPLVAIIRLIESVADATPVIVHHDRDPKLLYPELAERGWGAETIPGEAGEVRLKLQRVR